MGTPPDIDAPARGRGARFPRPGKARDAEGRMPLMEHIRELRNRLIKAVLGLIAGMVIGWLIYPEAFTFIPGPYCRIAIQHATGCGADATSDPTSRGRRRESAPPTSPPYGRYSHRPRPPAATSNPPLVPADKSTNDCSDRSDD